MGKLVCRIVLVMLVMSLWGCASFDGYPERSGNVQEELEHLERYFDPNLIEQYEAEKDPNEKGSLRNRIVNGRMRAIDLHFNNFQQQLYKEGVGSAIGTDWAILGLGGAGSVVNSLRTTQTLSAVSGGVAGAKASWDKNAFFDKTMPALLTQMIALRKRVLAKIRTELLEGVDRYPLNEALIDVESYFFAGTMPGAISAIVEEAGATARKADERLQVVVLEKRTKDFVAAGRRKRVEQIIADINDLTDQRAIQLCKNPPVEDPAMDQLIKFRDPTDKRLTDGDVARAMLKMRAVLGKRDDEALDAWETALKTQ